MKSKMTDKRYIKIFFRVFPMERMNWDYVKILDDHKTVYIRCLQELARSKENVVPTFWTFKSDQVFYNNTQEEIYNQIKEDIFENLSLGHDAIIMGYGQTGSGKSLTISGIHRNFDDRGILLRLIPDLFQMKRDMIMKNRSTKMCIEMSYIEISRSIINDLLKPYPNTINLVKEVTRVKVNNEEAIFKHIFRGEGRKEFVDNPEYASHLGSSICTFHIMIKELDMQNCSPRYCKLHVLDLAGADTVGNFSCFSKNPHEVGVGNLTKTQLEQFFLVLASHIPEHIKVKYRLNPMIQYLGDSLKNSTILRLIGHIRVAREDLLITISMLRFGQLIGGLKASKYEITINSNEVSLERLHQLQDELNRLKRQEKYNSILTHQDLSRSLNEERFAHVQRTVNEFLQNKITELTLFNVCDVNVALEIMKMMIKKYEEEKIKADAAIAAATSKSKRPSTSVAPKTSRSSRASGSDLQSKGRVSGSAKLKPSSRDVIQRVTSPLAANKSKTSTSSLLRRSFTGAKKKSQASASKTAILLPDDVPPEYSEAWDSFLQERSEEYHEFIEWYQQNETNAKIAYQAYLEEVEKLHDIMERADKIKDNLFLAQTTRDIEGGLQEQLTDYQKCAMQELHRLEQEQHEKHEETLRAQAELKAYMTVCKQIKKDVKDRFEQYCREKYQMPITDIIAEEGLMVIEEALEEHAALEQKFSEIMRPKRDKVTVKFDEFKSLMAEEQRRRRLYQSKHKEWVKH